MWPAKNRRPLVVAMCLALAVAASLLLRWSRPAPALPAEGPPSVPCTTVLEQTGWVHAVAFSPRGDLLALGVGVGLSRGHGVLWDLATGQVRATLANTGGAVFALAFTADGRHLATGSAEGAVTVWDVASACGRIVRGHGHPLLQLAFAAGGETLAAGSYFDATVWDLRRGGTGRTLPGRASVYFTTEGEARAFDANDGIPLAVNPGGRTWAVVVPASPKTMQIWDAEARRPRATLIGHDDAVTAAAFSPDGRTLATASNDRTIRLWDVPSGKLRATRTGHAGAVYCVAFSPDGRTLASGGFDKAVKLWTLERGDP